MPGRWKFNTLPKGQDDGQARLSLAITPVLDSLAVKVHIGSGQDIGAGPGGENGKGLHVEVRAQILPHVDEQAVAEVPRRQRPAPLPVLRARASLVGA